LPNSALPRTLATCAAISPVFGRSTSLTPRSPRRRRLGLPGAIRFPTHTKYIFARLHGVRVIGVRPQQLGEADRLQKWLKHLSASAQLEFEDVADFLWKVPRFIEHERQLELTKLDDYFPDNPELRERRWMFEFSKLNHTFQYLVATGNLFCAVSLFETYLLVLASGLQAYTGIRFKDVKRARPIDNQYCHILCNYLHTYFAGLCEATNAALDLGSERAVAANNSNSASGTPT
jgi:hypothetical protein